jgi:uncharacterized membrane protein
MALDPAISGAIGPARHADGVRYKPGHFPGVLIWASARRCNLDFTEHRVGYTGSQPRAVRSTSKEEATVTLTVDRTLQRTLHPLHAFALAAAVPLFLGGMLSDIAYSSSYQVQWTNFASWLIAGGLVFCGLALLCALVDLFRADHRGGRLLVDSLLLLATWVLGFVNALIHARDAWASMPTGLVLSVIVVVLACLAAWVGFSSLRTGGAS